MLDNEKNTRILYIHGADETSLFYLIKVKIVNEGKLFQNSLSFDTIFSTHPLPTPL